MNGEVIHDQAVSVGVSEAKDPCDRREYKLVHYLQATQKLIEVEHF